MTDLIKRIAVDPQTHKKIQVLRQVHYGGLDEIAALTRFLVDDAWQEAISAGLVKDAMLEDSIASHAGAKSAAKM
jgi:undecaprenyl pyrophosphate synthase